MAATLAVVATRKGSLWFVICTIIIPFVIPSGVDCTVISRRGMRNGDDNEEKRRRKGRLPVGHIIMDHHDNKNNNAVDSPNDEDGLF